MEQQPQSNTQDIPKQLNKLTAGQLERMEQKLKQCITDNSENENPTLSTKAYLKLEQIQYLISDARKVLQKEKALLKLTGPVKIVGNTHGYLKQVLTMFKHSGFPQNCNYLFLGSYVGYGPNSIQLLCLLLIYKVRHPQNFLLLRGYYDLPEMSRIFGFYDDCLRKYDIKLWTQFNDLFQCFPVCALIDGQIFCASSGLTGKCTKVELIESFLEQQKAYKTQSHSMKYDFMCSTPMLKQLKFTAQVQLKKRKPNFSLELLKTFFEQNGVKLLVRSNAICIQGVKFEAGCRVLSLCSIARLRECNNIGAILCVSETLQCSFQLYK